MVAVAVVIAITFLGSDRLVWFDAALVGYLFGMVFAVFGVVYRYAVWLRRPPTAMLNRRGWDAFRQRKGRNLAALPSLVATQLLAQGFIRRRSRSRWLAHQLVFWGCILAALVTFPLTLGLAALRERRPAGRPLPGVRVAGRHGAASTPRASSAGSSSTPSTSPRCWCWPACSSSCAAGCAIPGALAVERSDDFLALAGLFAVSVTGLFLTVSSTWLEGRFYSALNTVHALTVILGLMYMPVRQAVPHLPAAGQPRRRLLQARRTPRARRRSAAGAARASPAPSRSPTSQAVLPQVGFDYAIDGGGNYQDTCPRCRRAEVTLAQSARVGGFG